jgi:8-oxo-dGTP pyrophosphatase MutT (NUDIX family)
MIGITEQNELLVIKQYRHGAGIISLEIPAGTTEAGEDPKHAAVREMLEETGYQFDQIEEIATLYANPATSGNITYTYLMTG